MATLYPCISVYWQPGPRSPLAPVIITGLWVLAAPGFIPQGSLPLPCLCAGCSSALTFALQMVLRPLNVVTFKLVHTCAASCLQFRIMFTVQAKGLINKRHVIVYVHRPIRSLMPVLQTLTKHGTRDEDESWILVDDATCCRGQVTSS